MNDRCYVAATTTQGVLSRHDGKRVYIIIDGVGEMWFEHVCVDTRTLLDTYKGTRISVVVDTLIGITHLYMGDTRIG